TSDAEASRRFFQDQVGLQFVEDSAWALVFSVGGAPLRIQKVEKVPEVGYTVLGWVVDDIRMELKELAARGVVFERYPQLPQDDDGVWTTPDGAQIAWFKDPDGNTLSLTQA
ncbi:MAG: VOC family protein, partial [Longimicrobiales bacterium]